MDKTVYSIYSSFKNKWCHECEGDCGVCHIADILNSMKELEESGENEGCFVCLDKKGKSKDVFYDSGRGGLSIAQYCPNCGRKI